MCHFRWSHCTREHGSGNGRFQDRSTEYDYQFEFEFEFDCECYGNGYICSFQKSAVVQVVRTLLFGIRRREIGAALALYYPRYGTFLLIGLLTIPIGIVFNGVTLIATENPPLEWFVHWFNETAGARFIAPMSIGELQQITMVLVVAPPVFQAIKQILAGRSLSVVECLRDGYRRLTALALGLFIVSVSIGNLLLVLIGVPLAIWLSVRWQFFSQATILDDADGSRAALGRSVTMTRGYWWQTLSHTFVFQPIAVLPGQLIGLPLMLLGKTTVQLANSLSSVIFAVTVPLSVIGFTLAYERFREFHLYEESAAWEEPMPVGQGFATIGTLATNPALTTYCHAAILTPTLGCVNILKGWPSMDAYLNIISKRDIRRYTDEPIAGEVLTRILQGGRATGSARNRQQWEMVVIRNRETLGRLAGLVAAPDNIRGCAAAVAVVLKGQSAWDGGRMAQNLMLAAWSQGIGSCPNTPVQKDDTKAILGVSEDAEVLTILSLGYPAEPVPRGGDADAIVARIDRKPLAELTRYLD